VPLITKSSVEGAIRTRRRRPIFMVDLAVPRDIDPAVAELEDVYLFSIDDLQTVIDENRQQRAAAAGGAKLLIDEEVARFLTDTRVKDAGPPSARCATKPTRYACRPWSRRGACWRRANPRMKRSNFSPIP